MRSREMRFQPQKIIFPAAAVTDENILQLKLSANFRAVQKHRSDDPFACLIQILMKQ